MKRMNLLPRPPRRRDLRWKELFLELPPPLRLAAAASILLVLGSVGQGILFWRYRVGIERFKKEMVRVRSLSVQQKTQQQALSARRAQGVAQREQLEARRRALIGARQPEVPVSVVMAELAQALPDQVWITKLQFVDTVLKIEGASDDTQSISNLMAKLDGSNRFRDTKFAYTQRSQTAGAAFTFEVTTTPVLEEMKSS